MELVKQGLLESRLSSRVGHDLYEVREALADLNDGVPMAKCKGIRERRGREV